MQVKVPYITIDSLARVLDTLVSSSIITPEQSAIISGEAEILRQTMIRKSQEEKKARDMRQQCYSIAKKQAAATRRAISEQMKTDADHLGIDLTDEHSRLESRIAEIRQLRDIDLLSLQLDIDILQSDRLRLSVGSDPYRDNIDKQRQLTRRRSEIKAKAAADLDAARAQGRQAIKDIHATYAESQALLRRRMEAASEAYELVRSAIENAPDADLPALLAELQSKKGGER